MQLIHVGKTGLPLAEYRGQRVVTFAMIDRAHRRPSGTAGRNFRENRQYLIEGEDYWELTADEIRRQSLQEFFPPRTAKGILLAETGYLMVVKSLKDQLAWQVQRELVRSYFRRPEDAPELRAEMAALREDVSFLRRLLEPRFTRKPNKPNRPLSQEERSQMRTMFLDGRDVAEIAGATGRSAASVSWTVRCVKEEMERQQEGGAS